MNSVSSAPLLPPKFDPTDPLTIADPYGRYAELRAAAPVCRAFIPGQLAITRHAHVASLLSDPRLGMEFTAEAFSEAASPLRSFFRNIVFEQNPPTHKRLRRFLSAAFSRTAMRRLLERLDASIELLMTPLLERCEFDAVGELAAAVPRLAVGELLGVAPEMLGSFAASAREFHELTYAQMHRLTDNGTAEFAAARTATLLGWLRARCHELIDERRRVPSEDLTSQLARLDINGDSLSDEEIADNLIFLFFAGLDSSRDLISTGCVALAQSPEQWQLLKREPDSVPCAVEEFLRYDAPIQALARRALESFDVAGRTVRAGRVLWLLIGSANHDEQVFEDPQRLRVMRKPNPHVTFGGGMHSCLAAHVARAAAAMVFRRLIASCANIQLLDTPTRRHSIESRSYQHARVRLVRA